jgi:serine/threonine protein kinase
LQVLELYEYFPHGSSIVIAFEYMQSDLHQVIRTLGTDLAMFAGSSLCGYNIWLIPVRPVVRSDAGQVPAGACDQVRDADAAQGRGRRPRKQPDSQGAASFSALSSDSLGAFEQDLKPANLLFSPAGVLKLGDFGACYQTRSLHVTRPMSANRLGSRARYGARRIIFARGRHTVSQPERVCSFTAMADPSVALLPVLRWQLVPRT